MGAVFGSPLCNSLSSSVQFEGSFSGKICLGGASALLNAVSFSCLVCLLQIQW